MIIQSQVKSELNNFGSMQIKKVSEDFFDKKFYHFIITVNAVRTVKKYFKPILKYRKIKLWFMKNAKLR